MQRKFLPPAVCLILLSPSLAATAPAPPEPDATVVRADIRVKSVRLTDNGDNDGVADPNETVSVYVTLRNGSGSDRHGIVVTIASTDPAVDCIPSPTLAFGSLAAGEVRESTTAATFRVADVTRIDPTAELTATFGFQISGDDFDGTTRAQQVTLDLDLNLGGGLLPSTFSEGFEGAGFGAFTTMTLDEGMETLERSDRYRCQYNDPDGPNPNSTTNTHCFLGFVNASSNAFDWHIHNIGSPDGGRAFLGAQSLHWGVHPGAASGDTTRLKQLDALRTTLPVNLGWNGVTSQLSFKHQVGLTDNDYTFGGFQHEAVDRGIVQIQLATSAGVAVGSWRKIHPYENVYDSQGEDSYTNCTFDPVDDGTTEDDYFHPSDPARRLGPSSTCFPEFAFSRLGAIAFDAVFDPGDIHHASDGPGLQGVRGPGTWVESKFDLSRWRGRRVRLRFLTTSIEVGTAATMQQALGWNPIEADDGWYIDDVQVTNTLVSATTVTVDTADRSGLPACGPVCGSVIASLTATPETVGPGEEVMLDASASMADACAGGALHYRFWLDTDENDILGTIQDVVLQEWDPNDLVTHLRDSTSTYAVEARCSTRPACAGSAAVEVPLVCQGITGIPFPSSIGFQGTTQIAWEDIGNRTDAIRGDLLALRSSGGQFDGTVQGCLLNNSFQSFLQDLTEPGPGQGFYYLLRRDTFSAVCTVQSWGTGSPFEVPGAGGDRDADIPADPDTCSSSF